MDEVKKFFKAQLDEIRENKLRFGLIISCLIVVIIFAALDSESVEEIPLAQKNSVNVDRQTKFAATSETVKALIGANSDEVFVQDPFESPAQFVKVEEKILPPVEQINPVIFEPPKVENKLPEEKFVLKGVAIGAESTALVTKIVGDKSETTFLKIGDKIKGKAVVSIGRDFLTLEDGEKIFVTNN